MQDGWEVANGLDPLADDASGDPDNDRLTNLQEHNVGTDPFSADTDGDGMPDDWEHDNGLNPVVDDANGDLDKDGVGNRAEYATGFDPNHPGSRPARGTHYRYDEIGRIKSVTRVK